jgi:hypothetical protein
VHIKDGASKQIKTLLLLLAMAAATAANAF